MHLLNIETHCLENFEGNNVPLYAILSHTWGDDEIVFGDIGNKERCAGARYDKVKMTCSIAKRDGFGYVWINTCCIDKTSSAELSEAINSMYRWYQEAGICYAYLADVPSNDTDDQTRTICSEFFESRWFTRGWTLQELIAPSEIIFLGKTWKKMGSKLRMKAEISKITGIPEFILQDGDLQFASIAQRMSWASKRKTTRIEDSAYCLMGLFGINMPMLYGEGERAFIRLQEEIMKVSDDHSLFAWESSDSCGSLLATSPAAFVNSRRIIPVDSSSGLNGTITINNKGINITLPLMETKRFPTESVRLAILPCAVEGDLGNEVGIYVEAISEAHKYFMRIKSHKLETISAIDPRRSESFEANICVRQERQIHKKESSLVKAAEKGNKKVVKMLIKQGVDPNRDVLVSAARNGHDEVIKVLFEMGVNPRFIDKDCTALALAAENGHGPTVKLLLENDADPHGALLISAAKYGCDAVVKVLLEQGAKLNMKSFVLAAKYGHETVVKLMLERGADPDHALVIAAEKGQEAVVKVLLKVRPTKAARVYNRALESAIKNGQTETVKLILETNFKPDNSALVLAVKRDYETVVKWLLEKGVSPNAKDGSDQRVLSLVIKKENGRLAQLLIEKGAAPSEKALEFTAGNGYELALKLLLEKGAEPSTKALELAARNGHQGALRLLLEKGAQPSAEMLQLAIENGYDGAAKLLLKNGAQPTARALELAVKNGDDGTLKLLLEKGAQPGARALISAVQNGHTGALKLLLDGGSNPIPEVLELAAGHGFQGALKLLLKKGAKPSTRTLELAAENGHAGALKLLIKKGVKPSTQAIELAAENGHAGAMRLLLDKGAKPSARALKLATNNRHTGVVKLLIYMGANPSPDVLRLAAKNGFEGLRKLLG